MTPPRARQGLLLPERRDLFRIPSLNLDLRLALRTELSRPAYKTQRGSVPAEFCPAVPAHFRRSGLPSIPPLPSSPQQASLIHSAHCPGIRPHALRSLGTCAATIPWLAYCSQKHTHCTCRIQLSFGHNNHSIHRGRSITSVAS